MTTLPPSGVFCTADTGTTTVSLTVCATMATVTVVPGRKRPSGFAACTQTSTVVLLGSSAGLTSATLPST